MLVALEASNHDWRIASRGRVVQRLGIALIAVRRQSAPQDCAENEAPTKNRLHEFLLTCV